MSTKKANVATSEKSENNTENKNTSLQVVKKETEQNTPPEFKNALSLSDRLKAMNQVNQKIEKLRVMKEHRDNLEGWEASTDGMKERLTISDGSGTDFRFSNGEIISKVKALLNTEMNTKISEIENEILMMQI
jgi:hypothetical protein